MNHKKSGLISLLLIFSLSLIITLLSTKPWISIADSGEISLRELAQKRGFYLGSAAQASVLAQNPPYKAVLGREFNSLTPENEMKFESISPSQGQYDFTQADRLIDFAKSQNMRVHAHTLVWHSQLPKWLSEGTFNQEQLRAILKNHIQTVAGHFRGKVAVWDVINEGMNDDGTLRKTLWSSIIGPDYIPLAFQWAREADPNAILIYNDYGGEGLNTKSDGIYQYVKSLKEKGVPIDGVGLQMHVSLLYGPNELDFRDNIKRLADLGLKVFITEMDVAIQKAPESLPEKLRLQAQVYARTLRACLSVPACQELTLWGFTDKYSWIPWFTGNADAPLIFDENFKPKPAYFAIQKILKS